MFSFKRINTLFFYKNPLFIFIFYVRNLCWINNMFKNIYFVKRNMYQLPINLKFSFFSFLNHTTTINFFFKKFYLLWRGFKILFFKKCLHILFGFSHYIKFWWKNLNYFCFCKKRKIFFFSWVNIPLKSFIFNLKKSAKLNLYKGKGLFEYKNFKGRIKLRAWKKKH